MYVRGVMAQQFSLGTVVPEGSWVELPNLGAVASLGNQAAGADFGQLLAMLEAAGEVESTGQTTIDGVAVDGYRTTITSRDLLAAQGMNEDEVVEAMLATQPGAVRDALSDEQVAELTGVLDLEQDFQVWVDGDDLPRRVVTTIDDFGEMAERAMTMQYDILEYGVDVDVQPPPADQVVVIE